LVLAEGEITVAPFFRVVHSEKNLRMLNYIFSHSANDEIRDEFQTYV